MIGHEKRSYSALLVKPAQRGFVRRIAAAQSSRQNGRDELKSYDRLIGNSNRKDGLIMRSAICVKPPRRGNRGRRLEPRSTRQGKAISYKRQFPSPSSLSYADPAVEMTICCYAVVTLCLLLALCCSGLVVAHVEKSSDDSSTYTC